MPTLCKPSRYNHAFPYKGDMLLFNGLSSALTVVPRDLYQRIEEYLLAGGLFDMDGIPDAVLRGFLDGLASGKFFVAAEMDELDILRRRTQHHKKIQPMSLTLATTMDCNLGCYYCFEEKYHSYMDHETCDLIFDYTVQKIEREKIKSLYITWFGGEPMLNPDAIEYLSQKVIAFCDARQVAYMGSMISNGTCWPEPAEDIAAFAAHNRIMHVQFTFDGLPDNHNKRRRYIHPGAELSSFEAMARTISALVGKIRMSFRMNCDPGSVNDLFGLIDLFVERKWLYPGSGVYPYAARIRPATETCDFVQNHMVDFSEFNQTNNEFLRYVARFMDPAEFAGLIYPKAVKVGCDAVNPNGLMVGPDGTLYKCTEDMGDHKRGQGHIRDRIRQARSAALFPILSQGLGSAANNYDAFDPYSQPTCSVCKYLPQCMSGCPKDQLEKHRRMNENRANTDAFKQYWDDSLGPLITMYADITLGQNGTAVKPAPLDEYLDQMRQESVRVGMS
jgi:uncharacterized protein